MRLPIPFRGDRRHLLTLFAGLAVSGVTMAQGTAWDLGQLMRTLAQVKSGAASFTEVRTVPLLDKTLQSSGRLSFEAPDVFVRETMKPRHDRVEVVGNQVTMSLGSRSRTVPLDSVPEAAVIMEAIRGTLTGNREAIDRNFESTVSGTPQRWTLELKPREPRLQLLVTSVRVSGENAMLREVAVAMSGGDRSVMTLSPLLPATSASTPG